MRKLTTYLIAVCALATTLGCSKLTSNKRSGSDASESAALQGAAGGTASADASADQRAAAATDKGAAWHCEAVGTNFADAASYAGEGATRDAATANAIKTCEASHPNGKCAITAKAVPGIVSLGGCARVK